MNNWRARLTHRKDKRSTVPFAWAHTRSPGLLVGIILLLALPLLTPGKARAADPEAVAVASLLLPGLGQVINGDYGWGLVHMGLYFNTAGHYLDLTEDPGYIPPEERDDEQNRIIRTNRVTYKADLYGTAASSVFLYSPFAAYRDARQMAENQGGYSTPVPSESLTDLALSPFNPEHLIQPGTIIPLLLPLYLAFSPASAESWVIQPEDDLTLTEMRRGAFFQHNMVAVGEEAFFRGYLNNGLSDWLGPGWGLTSSSALFGVAHTGNAGSANAGVAFVFGLYLGYLQQLNDYAIGQGVALHYWWNVLVSLAMLKERPQGVVMPVNISLRF